jgi:hypothetical protein
MGRAVREGMLLRVGRVIFVAHVVVVTVVAYRVDNFRSPAPSWPESVARAQRECAQLPADAVVAIPQDPLPFWLVRVECRDL